VALARIGGIFDLLCDRFLIGQSLAEGEGAPVARAVLGWRDRSHRSC
jgi:hypothetical protein